MMTKTVETFHLLPNKRLATLTSILYGPKTVVPEKNYPLILFLHGAGERGTDVELVHVNGLPTMIEEGFETEAFVLCPQCPADAIWNTFTAELHDLVEDACSRLPIDRARISCTGISMGGYGTWAMTCEYPELFCAAAPICGGGVSWYADAVKQTPIWIVHGDADSVVPVRNSLDMYDKLIQSGCDVQLTLCHGVDHNCWDFAYRQTTINRWLQQPRKK